MLAYLKYWPYAVILFLAMSLGVQSYRLKSCQLKEAESELTVTKQAVKDVNIREGVENANRNLSGNDIDSKLRANGWMRD